VNAPPMYAALIAGSISGSVCVRRDGIRGPRLGLARVPRRHARPAQPARAHPVTRSAVRRRA
jgi:hypothetical protein